MSAPRPDGPPIPATVIGSWSFPGWFEAFQSEIAGRAGPADREEAVRDAVRVVVEDQLRAGLDRITDAAADAPSWQKWSQGLLKESLAGKI